MPYSNESGHGKVQGGITVNNWELFMKNKLLSLIFILFVFLTVTACDTTFKGKVIDADTKRPIEGAVVVAAWHEEQATPTGSTLKLKDVTEALTDKKGEWVIKGTRGREMGNITAIFTLLTGTYITNPPHFIIFKPAYCPWSVEAFGIDTCEGKIRPGGQDKVADGITVELPKLTSKEDRLRALPSPVAGENALKKQKDFLRLINEESKYLNIPEAYH